MTGRIFKISLAILLILTCTFALPNAVWAFWNPTEDMESYNNLDTLDGETGGSGWGANAWVDTGTVRWLITTSSPIEGAKSAKVTGAGAGDAYRDFTAITSGQFSVLIRLVGAHPSKIGIYDGATPKGLIVQDETANGNLDILNNATYQSFDTYGNPETFTIEIAFGGAAGGNNCVSGQYEARKNTGTWSGCKTMPNSGGNVTRIKLEYQDSVGREFWADDIENTGAPDATTFDFQPYNAALWNNYF